MPIVNSHIVPQVACPGDNPLLALLEEKPGAGILNRVSCVIGHNEWARMIRLEASWLCKPVVVGSSPTGSTKNKFGLPCSLEATYLRKVGVMGSIPMWSTKLHTGFKDSRVLRDIRGMKLLVRRRKAILPRRKRTGLVRIQGGPLHWAVRETARQIDITAFTGYIFMGSHDPWWRVTMA